MVSRQNLNSFREYLAEIQHYEEAIALIDWDLRTKAPARGHELRAEAKGTLAAKVFEMKTSPIMQEFLSAFSDEQQRESLDDVERALVRVALEEFEYNQKLPKDRFKEYVVLVAKAESVWADAKTKDDFSLFQPYLEQIVAMKREFVTEYWGVKDHPYNTLLDRYEPGMTVGVLDSVFHGLREKTVSLVNRIVESGRKVNKSPFQGTFSRDKQRDLSRFMLERMGYDFSAGRLDETIHPFQVTLNRFDTRVTTRYDEHDFRVALFGTIHEGGHALYEQGISTDLIGTPLCTGTSTGIHESQSRFWENMIGRSLPFWEHNFDHLQNLFSSELGGVSLQDFYRYVNDVEPSLIRIEADEVTYNLHIMIRYEIEKGLMNNDFQVADLPEIWKQRMNEYLGVAPSTDADGVLQDVHWSGGDFGYFPSYALGNLYAAQFQHTMNKELGDIDALVRNGEYLTIRNWLNENIHKYGRVLEPSQLVERVTGEPLDSKYLVEYLEEKYTKLYQL